MNRHRRKKIEGVIAAIKEIAKLIEAQEIILFNILMAEEAYRDSTPKNSERFLPADFAAKALDAAHAELTAISLNTALIRLEEATL